MLHPKSSLGIHPPILGQPWLVIDDTFIGFHSGSMTISDGYDTKKLTLYPHATPNAEPENSLWMDTEDESALPVLNMGKALSFKDEMKDELINYFICDPSVVTQHTHCQLIRVFDPMAQEEMNLEMFFEPTDNQSDSTVTIVAVTTNVVTIDDET
jgi:hypothetical protein